MEKKTTRRKMDWQQFFISVLGTAIGVALTFVVSGMMERRAQRQAQRLTAVMVIHDIDESIDILRSKKKPEEENGKLLQYALDNRDHLDKMSYDTLTAITFALLEPYSEFRFDTSKEKVFNSDLDTWQNLGNMKFIDNVQSFFYNRHLFEEWFNGDGLWHKPVPREEYLQLFMGEGWLSEERVCEILWPFLKEKLYDKRVTYFIDVASYRLQNLNQTIDEWTALNEENKFLMGITDREMEEYVNSIVTEGDPVTKRSLLGQWLLTMEDNSYCEYTFSSDHSFTGVINQCTEGHWAYWTGVVKSQAKYSGTWEIQGDSLIFNINPITDSEGNFIVDGSGLVPAEGKRDSLDSWLIDFREQLVEEYRQLGENRHAIHSRMDSSHDKMKWVDFDGTVNYLKRKEQ